MSGTGAGRTVRFKVTIHGYSGYTAGCSCETCRKAKAKYMSKRRGAARAGGGTGFVADGITHGTRSGYEENGCRCIPCTDAKNASRREQSGRKRGSRCTACGHRYGTAEHEAACRSAA